MDEDKNLAGITVTPKNALILGIVMGVLGVCTIGFIMLAAKMFRGGPLALTDNQAPSFAVQPSTPEAGGAPSPGQQANVAVGHLPIRGNKDAKVTVIEFADFRCPFCERFYKDAIKSVLRDYVASGKVKYSFRHFAFLGQHSTWASEATECANEQGKFWQMHDWLYENQAPESDTEYYSKANLIKYAGKVGLNVDKFASCLNSDKYASAVAADVSDGQRAGVNGTPTIFINGRSIVGAQPYSTVKAAIDQALQGG